MMITMWKFPMQSWRWLAAVPKIWSHLGEKSNKRPFKSIVIVFCVKYGPLLLMAREQISGPMS